MTNGQHHAVRVLPVALPEPEPIRGHRVYNEYRAILKTEQRQAWDLDRRNKIETELREAEILLDLLKKHLARMDALMMEGP